MFGSVVDFQLLDQSTGLCWGKGLIQGGRRMGIQIILHQHDLLGGGILHIDEVADEVGPVYFGSASR